VPLSIEKVTIEYDCECDHGLCEHAAAEVERVIQRVYLKGYEDGKNSVSESLKSMLRSEFPVEYEEARRIQKIKRKDPRKKKKEWDM
jgi:hypothetical protein